MPADVGGTYDTHTRMRIRNDTQSKRDSRVNEKVNTGAWSHLRPRSAEAIRDTLGHRTERKRGTGFARWNIQDRKPLGKSKEIATHRRRSECRNWERLMRSRPIVRRGRVDNGRSFLWMGKKQLENCTTRFARGLARLWKCTMMKFLQGNNLFLHLDDR